MKISTKALFKLTYAQIKPSVQKFTKRLRVSLGTMSKW